MRIDGNRLQRSIEELGRIGETPRGGLTRLALTDEDRRGRDWMVARMREAGLRVAIDQMGNIFGERAGAEALPPVLMGSHVDSVPTGGKYAGQLGVLCGLETIRALNDHRIRTRRPVTLVIFTNEEGARFQPAMIASGVMAGKIALEDAYNTRDADGIRLADELERIGYLGSEPCVARPFRAYLELHIEQGPILEEEGLSVGVVEGIVAISWSRLTIHGVQDHAGPTPMRIRHDALVAAAQVVTGVPRIAHEIGGGAAAAPRRPRRPVHGGDRPRGDDLRALARRAQPLRRGVHAHGRHRERREHSFARRARPCRDDAVSPQEQWQLGGNAPEMYERHIVPALFTPWAQSLVATAALRAGERVLDVACGTGVVARLAAQRVGNTGKVVGLDLNAGMLAVARKLGSRGATVEWHEASALAMPLPDATFDVALCQQGLQFFPDRSLALREMRRVLAPRGRLVLSVWRSIEYSAGHKALATALERHVTPEAAAVMRAPFALDDPDELRALVTAAGFRDVEVDAATEKVRFPSVEDYPLQQAGATPVAPFVAKASDAARTALVRDVCEALAPYVTGKEVAWPIQAHVVRARV